MGLGQDTSGSMPHTFSYQISNKQLKGQCREIFASGFFRELPSPKPLKITVESFFGKFEEIFASEGAPPVSMTPFANNGNNIRLLIP